MVTKITQKQAQRLGDFLTKAGWSVWGMDTTVVKCHKCGRDCETKYCPDCGTKLEGTEEPTLSVLEKALDYALRDTVE